MVEIAEIPLVPALPADLLRNARVLASRNDILPHLPKHASICEVGVAYGDFSQEMLEVCRPERFLAIDLFNLEQHPSMWGYERLQGGGHLDFYRRRFTERIQAGQVEVLQGDSAEVLATLPDASVDVFYIDAWHTYEAVSAELAIVRDKIRPDGWIVLNDYLIFDVAGGLMYGVVPAVNEFMLRERWEMLFFALQPLMYCDVALRRLREPHPRHAG